MKTFLKVLAIVADIATIASLVLAVIQFLQGGGPSASEITPPGKLLHTVGLP